LIFDPSIVALTLAFHRRIRASKPQLIKPLSAAAGDIFESLEMPSWRRLVFMGRDCDERH
jgi:hypothetical protein